MELKQIMDQSRFNFFLNPERKTHNFDPRRCRKQLQIKKANLLPQLNHCNKNNKLTYLLASSCLVLVLLLAPLPSISHQNPPLPLLFDFTQS